MSSAKVVPSLVIAAALSALLAAGASADSSDLINRIPPGANAIAFINVESLLNSQMGVKEGWKEKLADAYAVKPLTVPPNAKQVLMASWIEPVGASPMWEVSLIELTKPVSVKRIATDENGFTDTIAGKQAAWSPINAWFVRLENHLLGVVCPADRQFTSRWAARTGATADSIAPYLRTALSKIDPKTDYMFALDLTDVVSEKRVRRRLADQEFACLSGKEIDANKVGAIVASIKGLRLAIDVDSDATGECTIEFGRPVSELSEFAKPLLMEILDNTGAAINDFNSWKMTAKDSTLQASGKLTSQGLRHLFSIVDPPSPTSTEEPAQPAAGNTAPDKPAAGASSAASAAASKKYFQAVSKIIDGIGDQVRTSSSMNKGATYIARDARKIDRLPILNVDPDLVAWGSGTSSRLIDVAAGLGVGGFSARSRTESVMDPSLNTGYDQWNELQEQRDPNDEVNRRNATRQRLAASAQQRADTLQQLSGLIKEIETGRANIRATMTQKYKTEF